MTQLYFAILITTILSSCNSVNEIDYSYYNNLMPDVAYPEPYLKICQSRYFYEEDLTIRFADAIEQDDQLIIYLDIDYQFYVELGLEEDQNIYYFPDPSYRYLVIDSIANYKDGKILFYRVCSDYVENVYNDYE